MKENEKAFLVLVKMGVYKVYKNGKVYKCKQSHRDWSGEYKDCRSRLINSKVRDYVIIPFTYNGKFTYIYAHRAVWIYFNGEIPEGLESNHKNGIKNDNRLSNLELVTQSENSQHAHKLGLIKNAVGENNGRHKLTEKKVLKIRKMLKEGITQCKIAEMFNVHHETISRINTRRAWIHVT